jgi:hypothetical protein
MKTSELTGAALNWAVAKCRGFSDYVPARDNHSTCWNKGGPIIEREKISVLDANGCWGARKTYWDSSRSSRDYFGPTPLIAAMRCYVASKLGDTVEIPKELTI